MHEGPQNGAPAGAMVGARIDFAPMPETGQVMIRIVSGPLAVQIPIAVAVVDPLVAHLRAVERAVTGARLALVDARGRPA